MIEISQQIGTRCWCVGLISKARVLLFVAILLIQSTCLSPLDIEPSDFEDFLVVQGFIDDDFGPHDIRITRVAKFASVRAGGTVSIIEGANVQIMNQFGESAPLERVRVQEKRRATCGFQIVTVTTDYRTLETFKGEIGSTYSLEIVTKEGLKNRSSPQTMLPTPPIDSLVVKYKELPGLDKIIPNSGVEVFASWHDPIEEENFYFWRLNGIYMLYTPDLSDEIRCCLYDTDGGAMRCFILEKNLLRNELAFSDRQVNGQIITLPVGFIKDDGFRFGDTSVPNDKLYHVEVEQYAIPQAAFEFNEKAKTLANINGDIFDPPPLSVGGNMFNINNPEERVIGYFGAYAKQTGEIFIPRSLLEFIHRFPDPCGDCRAFPGGQTEIPEPYK